jgi:hypothetical protein
MNLSYAITRIRHAAALFALLFAAISLCASGPSAAATSVAPKDALAYDAAFVSQTVPSFIALFTPTAVSVTMRNTGTATWYKADVDIFLGTQEPQDNYFWCIQDNRYGIYSGNRVLLPHDVAPGEDVRFDFVVKPLTCFFRATSPFRFRMISPTHGTFGEETPDPGVIVSTAAQFVSQQVPAIVPAKGTFQTTVTFKNMTNAAWNPDDGYALVPVSAASWGITSVPLPETVAAGAAVDFTFRATAPELLGNVPFQWQVTSGTGAALGEASVPAIVQVVAAGAINYGGLWWASPAGSEAGWGLDLTHEGDVVFMTWFTYDTTGRAMWLSMAAGLTKTGTYSGTLYRSTGPAFDASPFLSSQVRTAAVGTATLTFSDVGNATFAYSLQGVSQTKKITRQVFGTLPTCTFNLYSDLTKAYNYQDLWWAAPAGSEAGWGLNLTHQDDTIFAAWFTYDRDGAPLWMVMAADKSAPNTYTGSLYTGTGPPFSSVLFDPSKVNPVAVGTATLTFKDGNNAKFDYSIQFAGVPVTITQSKQITRQVFGPPGTVCQ